MKKNKTQLILSLVLIVAAIPTLLNAQLPDPGMIIDEHTALVFTDPQNDFLSPDGVTWGMVGKSVTANKKFVQSSKGK